MIKTKPLANLPGRTAVLLMLATCAVAYLLIPVRSNRVQVALAQESGDPDPSEYAGGEGYSCDDPNPCGGDACCGDPCCGDPCCGDPCCGDDCCGDPCCSNPGSCEPTCYDYCLQACGDNETCMPGYEDPETHECYAFESDFCCVWTTYCF
jgi:hypothetical protein